MCQTLSDAFDADLFGGCEVKKKKQKHAKLFMNAGFFFVGGKTEEKNSRETKKESLEVVRRAR